MKPDPIPLVDLQAQYRAIREEIDQAIRSVLSRGNFILGPEVGAFERELAAYCGTRYAVGVASGTDALELTLRACRIGPGDEVITPAFTFMATATAVSLAGATPVFVDIEPETHTLDPDQVARTVTPRTQAIIPVHLYGHPARMEEILSIAKRSGLKVIEDCAQAIGAECGGRRVGSLGEAGTFSFYPSKNLGAYGDGGAVVTSDSDLADRLRMLRWYGTRDRTEAELLGRNSRLDELQAAVLRVKLRHLDAWNQARRQRARTYGERCQASRLEEVLLPHAREGCTHIYHLFPIRLPRRDQIAQSLRGQGIGVQIHYDCILPEHPLFRPSQPVGLSFPAAQTAAREVLSLPMYPELTPEQIERVIRALKEATEGVS